MARSETMISFHQPSFVRKCTCCRHPFKAHSAIQRSSARAYCLGRLCQLYKERNLWKKPWKEAEAVLAAYAKVHRIPMIKRPEEDAA
jgi:hypothetical protein